MKQIIIEDIFEPLYDCILYKSGNTAKFEKFSRSGTIKALLAV